MEIVLGLKGIWLSSICFVYTNLLENIVFFLFNIIHFIVLLVADHSPPPGRGGGDMKPRSECPHIVGDKFCIILFFVCFLTYTVKFLTQTQFTPWLIRKVTDIHMR